jgi:hydroxypyruvate isomerase
LDRVAQPNVALQLDLYHTCMTEGHVEERIRALRGRFAHVQIAGCPGRNEPVHGRLDGHGLLTLLDAECYTGWVGLEYTPRTTTEAGLAWAAGYLSAAKAPAGWAS